MSKESISKIYLILEKIEYIDKIVEDSGSIIKALDDVRTYIAHDYEGVNLAIIEWIIRNGLPKFKEQCLELIY